MYKATFHDKTFNAHSKTTCLIHSDLFTVLKNGFLKIKKWLRITAIVKILKNSLKLKILKRVWKS